MCLLFYLKKPKNYQSGPQPVYLRITIDEKRAELSLGRECEPRLWSRKANRASGKSEFCRTLNAFIDQFQFKIYDAYEFLERHDEEISAEAVKDKFLGKKKIGVKIIEVFKEHNQKVEALVGKGFADGTLERYNTSLKHTQDFIKWKYKVDDLDVKKVNHLFISEYDFYLRTIRNCGNNSTVKYIKNFGKIVRICIANGWITVNPLLSYKPKVKHVERVFLNEEDLHALANKEFKVERIGQVRDIFLFSCYTGLAYADVKKLKRSEIVKGVDNELWIHTKRQKTDTNSRIPLLPAALRIIDLYKDHPVCCANGYLLPVLSNQKMNAYLKEIADLCGIDKELTYHIARHTFATTVTLMNGIPIETVSKMLGHTNIRITQHYAKTLDIKVGRDMDVLRRKFSSLNF